MKRLNWLLGLTLAVVPAPVVSGLDASAAAVPAAQGLNWNQTFKDVLVPLHLIATYPDALGQQQTLELWRDAAGRVVRRTAGKTELRLTPAPDAEDQYQLRNLAGRTAYDVHRTNLYRLGIFTDRWSVQHLLDRPLKPVTLQDLQRQGQFAARVCHWYRQQTGSQVLDICWSGALGIPLALKSSSRELLLIQQLQTGNIQWPGAALPADWYRFNADEDLGPD